MVDTVKMLCDRQDFVHILICVGGCVYRCLGEYGTCICRGCTYTRVHIYACGSQWLVSGVIPQENF